jgi:hypothetical protein
MMNNAAEIERIVQEMRFGMKQIAGLKKALDDIVVGGGGVPASRTVFGVALSSDVTKTAAGLDQVDNTADTDKPVSTATQSALDDKQNDLGFTAENVANKATDCSSNDDTHYPTTQAVNEAIAAAGGGGETVTFSNWLPLPTDNSPNSAGQSNRQVCVCLAVAGNRVRVKFQGHSTTSCTIDHASVGIRTGAASVTVATPVELLFSAASGCVVPAAGYIWSDEATLTIADLDNLVVIWDIAAAGTSSRRFNGSGSGTLYYKAATASYNAADPGAGYSTGTGVYMVQTINVRTA